VLDSSVQENQSEYFVQLLTREYLYSIPGFAKKLIQFQLCGKQQMLS